MKKFIKEVFTYFWIPLIIALVSYIFFQLHDVLLGIITLIVLSAVYTTIQLYFLHKKWWLGIILAVLALGYLLFFLFRAPTITLSVNGQEVRGASIEFAEGSVLVSPSPSSNGEYSKNTVITLTAQPSSGYDFKGWSGTSNDSANPTSVIMGKDKHVTAIFAPRYSVIINNQLVIGSLVSFTQGSVSVNPAPGGDGKYASGTIVSLTAAPNSGYDWGGWIGTNKDNSNPSSVTLSGDKQLTVTFAQRFSLTINNQLVIGTSLSFNEGSVFVNPAPGGDSKYSSGTSVTLTAVPNAGYDWKSWAGTGSDATNPATLTVNSDKFVSVSFNLRYALSVNSQPVNGSTEIVTGGTVAVNPAPGSDNLFTRGTNVTLTAVAAQGYRFDHWSGDVSGTGLSASVVMNANHAVTANFVKTWTLTTAILPATGGFVSPAGGTYDDGNSVSITATAATGYRFDHWSGDASGTAATTSVTMSSNKTVTANFVKTYALGTSVIPAAGGSVSPSSGTYDDGASVTLTATAASGYRFVNWGGDATGTTTSISLVMNGNKNVTATFIKTYTLTTAVDPAGGGSVSPGNGTFDDGASVTMTATAAAGYRFDHWSGDATGTANPVTITINSNKGVTATFVKTFTLTVSILPAGGGTVTGGGIYDSGATATLTATPAAGYVFDHWSGDALGTVATVTVTVNSNKVVTANFVLVSTPPTTTAILRNNTSAREVNSTLAAVSGSAPRPSSFWGRVWAGLRSRTIALFICR